jgi:intron-binding protein aquarius
VQIISNIYHNFPNQRTLLVTRSNAALNQLFEKIVALDIADRHLLRLGRGEEDLLTEANFGKSGRVEVFLERRGRLLGEVERLSGGLGVPGAHGNSCETAGYFNQVYIRPLWAKFEEASSSTKTAEDVIQAFPFRKAPPFRTYLTHRRFLFKRSTTGVSRWNFSGRSSTDRSRLPFTHLDHV